MDERCGDDPDRMIKFSEGGGIRYDYEYDLMGRLAERPVYKVCGGTGMTIDEMSGLFYVANVNISKLSESCFQEYHDIYDDYYELDLVNDIGEIYYITQEISSIRELVCYFESKEQAISFFGLFLISKNKNINIGKNKKIISKLIKEQKTEELKNIISEYIEGIDYTFCENTAVDINFLDTGKDFQIRINKNNKLVYAIKAGSGIRAQILLLEYLYKNAEIKEILYRASASKIYSDVLGMEEYYMYFNPYGYIDQHNYSSEGFGRKTQ